MKIWLLKDVQLSLQERSFSLPFFRRKQLCIILLCVFQPFLFRAVFISFFQAVCGLNTFEQ